jgi:hypothetical protein
MNEADIRRWLTDNGFEAVGDFAYAAPFMDTNRVLVEFSSSLTHISVIIDNGLQETTVSSCAVKRASIDESGMLSGVGLVSPFLDHFTRSGIRPIWFSDAFVERLGAHATDHKAAIPR